MARGRTLRDTPAFATRHPLVEDARAHTSDSRLLGALGLAVVVATIGLRVTGSAVWLVVAVALCARALSTWSGSRTSAVLFVAILSLSTPLPQWARLLLEGVLFVGSLGICLSALASRRQQAFSSFLAMCVVSYWLFLVFHPNVPDLGTGLVGFRKSALVFVGLAAGIGLASRAAWTIERLVSATLLLTGALSLSVHFFASDFEAGIQRDAAVYTSLFSGAARLQGVLPGPFHAALLGAVLALYGLYGVLQRQGLYASACAIVGVVLLQQTQVRSGLVAAGAGLVLLPLLARRRNSGRSRRRMFLGALALGVIATTVLLLLGDAATTSVGTLSSDTRAQQRLLTWSEGWEMFLESPVVGWGAGSAGDTLGDEFHTGRHVTSHNLLLKYLVEGGIIGFALVSAAVLAAATALRRNGALRDVALLAPFGLFVLAVMGLSGASTESNPIAMLICLAVGATAATRKERSAT